MIKKNIHKITCIAALMCAVVISAKAQYASEDELKTAANEMFEEANYVGSLKLFGQLLSNYPKDPSYNYKYGACVLFGSRDKEKSLKYLEFAITKPNVDPVAYYFLAKAYHHNYQFAPAVVNYNKFKNKADQKDLQKFKVDRAIKMCENGQQLIKSMADIGVLSKKEIKDTDFFRSYKLNGIGGKVIVKPDDFKTKFDLKNNEKSLIYLGAKKDMVVYSSFGKSGSTGKDIYKVVKLPTGEWSKPVLLSDAVNTEFDEDYPFLHPDGRTLYFSSKGFNSMGGYDIFKSTMDASGQWSFPENLDFPINTPGDDILYISDIDNKLAYFASSRASKQGELTVYNVTVKSTPTQHSIVKGFFLAESNPLMKSATITVKDAENERRYGVYKTHDVTGEYLLTFPSNGGKFKLLVETTNEAPVHAAIIELPELDGFRALKQELRLVGTGDEEKLVVKNLFDESDEFDMSDPLVVQNLLKQKAKLEVNTTEEEINNALASGSESTNETQSAYADLSDDQIVNNTDQTATKIIDQTEASKKQVNTSYQIANAKSAEAKEIYNQAKTFADNGALEKAESKKLEAAKLINEMAAALAMAKTIDNEVVERESDLAQVKKLQEAVNTDIDNGNRAAAEKNLADLDKIASATYHNESALETEEQILANDLAEKQRIYAKNRDAVTELKNRQYELAETINKLNAKKEETKKKNEKADLAARIEALKIDAEDAEFDLDRIAAKGTASKTTYLAAKNKMASTTAVVATLTNGDNLESPIEASVKLQLENDLIYFEKEGLVGLYADESATSTEIDNGLVAEESGSYNIAEHKDEFNIVDESGKIIDYDANYNAELAEAAAADNEEERAGIVMKINESWIKDINEELAIRNKQLASETELGEKISLKEKIEVLENLKLEKQKEFIESEEFLASNISDTEKPLLTEGDGSAVASAEIGAISEEVNIMNTDGSIVDYGAQYASELDLVDQEDNFESYSKKSKIHKNWASAIEQEVLIKKMELVEADASEKNGIENEIAVLESNLIEQQEFSALYEMQAASLAPIESVATETLAKASNTSNVSEGSASSEAMNSSTTAVTTSNDDEELPLADSVASNGALNVENSEEITAVYNGEDYKENYTSKLAAIGDEDSYENTMQKVAVHSNWATTIESKISERKEVLATAGDDKKNDMANEIAILESDLIEQQEFSSLYAMQAESLAPAGSNTSEILANTAVDGVDAAKLVGNEDVNSSTAALSNNIEDTELPSETVAGKNDGLNVETSKEITAGYDGEDYKENYTTKLAAIGDEQSYKTTMQKVAVHSNWAKTIESKISERKEVLPTVSDDKKNEIANEIAILESDLIEQQEFAGLYEAQAQTMAPAGVNPREEILATSNEETNTNAASMGVEESVGEDVALNNGESIVSDVQPEFSTKLLEEDLTENNLGGPEDDFSNLKYNNRFNYTSGQSKMDLASIISLKDEARTLKEEGETKMMAAEEISWEDEKEIAVKAANEFLEKSERKQEQIAKVYENANRNEYYNNQSLISTLKNDNGVPDSDVILRSELFTEEADNLYDEAKVKRDEAKDASSFAGRESALQKAYELEMKAIEKQLMAMNTISEGELLASSANASDNEARAETVAASNNGDVLVNSTPDENSLVPVATSSEISGEDQKVLLKLQPKEITAIKNSEDYIAFAALKEKKRRLIKEAEVEYVEAEKMEQEAKDQEQLGISLRAMAAGASTEEDKVKKLAQIKKLEQMIADNEAKSSELKTSAANKETQAKEASDQSDFILISAEENDAKNFNAIEKTETFDKAFMAQLMSRSASVAAAEEPLELAIAAESNAEELPNANEELESEGANWEEEGMNENPVMADEAVSNDVEIVAAIEAENTDDSISAEGELSGEEVSSAEEQTIAEPLTVNEEPVVNSGDDFVAKQSPSDNKESLSSITAPENIDVIPSVLSESIFVINNNKAAYSNSNKIPVSSKLPEGLVFKVQVGAFRNPIPQDHFRGFAPILAENAGNGITRYTAGLFKSFNVADEAKRMIRDIGYSDAFVVAFFNGKRINMTEARAILNENPVAEESIAQNISPENTSAETNSESGNIPNTTAAEEEEEAPIATEEVKDGVSTDVRNIDGAFYTIQVGVYSKEVTAGQLNNVSPLNSERTAGGLIRYTSGVYKTLAEVNDAKDRIRGIGIADAFVIAYKGGRRVTVAEVTSVLAENIATPNPVEEISSEEIVSTNVPEEETIDENEAEEEEAEVSEVAKKLNVLFKVQVGEYTEDVPVEDAGLFLKLNSRGIENYEEADKTVYTIGSFNDYQSALDLQIEMKEMGVKNPKTIAFKEGVRIELVEALELIKNNQ